MFRFLLRLLFPAPVLDGVDRRAVDALRGKAPVVLERDQLQRLGMLSIDRLFAAQSYDDSPIIKTLLWKWKYKHMTVLADDIARLIFPAAAMIDAKNAVLCPVPLHWSRRFLRGFNQSEVLAKAVAAKRGWPVRSLLKRTRATGFQSHRSRVERLSAMKNAFVAVGPMPDHVILVDDVVTTGSTLEECAKVLRLAGVKRIEAVVVARG